MFTVSERVLEQCNDKMEAAIQAMSEKGLWALVEYRWIPYIKNHMEYESAKVPILKVLNTAQ